MKRKRTDHGMNSPPATTTAQHAAHITFGTSGGSGFNDTGQGGVHIRKKVEVGTTSG